MRREAALFWNGRSQAVRLPKEMRFKGDKVWVEKSGELLILKPYEKEWPPEFWDCLGQASSDFERPVHVDNVREVFP